MKVPPSPPAGPPLAPRRRTRSGETPAARPSGSRPAPAEAAPEAEPLRSPEADTLWRGRTATTRKEARPQTPPAPGEGPAAGRRPPRDGFGTASTQGRAAIQRVRESLGAEVPQQLPTARAAGEDAVSALNRAEPPGVYWREEEHEGRHDEEGEDPELAEAVEEAIRLLFGVAGIHRVSPGRDQEGQPVVLIVATRGFGAASLARIPETVHRFRTLLVMPYDLLPLRRL